jgi:peptidoglycan/xylan/chitin deacetylase (PgdA/CDA1 family)
MKRAIKTLAHRLGFWRLAYRLRRKPILAAFTFHRVTDHATAPEYYLGYDRGLDVREFRGQLDAIGEYFTVISLDKFRDFVLGHESPREHSALLTFDDADSEFIVHVLPALQKRNWPAVVFTPVDFVDGDKFFWHVWVGHLLHVMTEEDLGRVRSLAGLPKSIGAAIAGGSRLSDQRRPEMARLLVRALNGLDDNEILDVVERIRQCCPGASLPTIHSMDWREHKQLIQNSIAVQSHTMHHRRLAKLQRHEIAAELVDSKQKLETQLSMPVYALCYPQGSFNDIVLEEASRAGYALGFTTRFGVCRYPVEPDSLLQLPRAGVWSGSAADWHWSLGRLLMAPAGPPVAIPPQNHSPRVAG